MEAIVKGIIFSMNSSKILKILKDLKYLFDDQKLEPNFYLLRNARIIHIYSIFLIFATFMLTMLPILVSLVKFIVSGHWPKVFPTEAWYPFDPVDYYVPIYMFHVLAFGSYASCGLATEAMLLMILNYINQQFRYISMELSASKRHKNLNDLIEKHCFMTE